MQKSKHLEHFNNLKTDHKKITYVNFRGRIVVHRRTCESIRKIQQRNRRIGARAIKPKLGRWNVREQYGKRNDKK